MHVRIIAALLCGCAAASAAVADTVVVNDQVQVRESQTPTPHRGTTMSDVEALRCAGQPPPDGGPAPHHPLGLQRLCRVLRTRPRDSRGGNRRLST